MAKRKLDSDDLEEPEKRIKVTATAGPSSVQPQAPHPLPTISDSTGVSVNAETINELPANVDGKGKATASASTQEPRQNRQRRHVNKLKPARPFPTVPTSVSATGPRSSHREGKNFICITRKTPLGNYMRRCKKVILEDGYKTLHLNAMGAAIPLLLQLVCALPPILPFSQDEIQWKATTGTTEVQDEVIPEDEDEDILYRTRGKSTLAIVFKIGDGEFEGDRGAIRKYSAGKSAPKNSRPPRAMPDPKGKGKAVEEQHQLVYEEPEQEFMDML